MMVFRDKKVVFDAPKVMGILNVTPDSFSDGGKFSKIDAALYQAESMVKLGATFIDVGGESTRPGAQEVSVEQELERVIPVIEAIESRLDTIVSIDTSKPEVMQASVDAGASLINDVRALSLPNALKVASSLAKSHNVPTCLMHMKGTPKTMQSEPQYTDILFEVTDFFERKIKLCTEAGFTYKQLLLDPGFGFGKTLEHNYQLLKHLSEFSQFDMPIISGTSRKSMIGSLLEKPVEKRLSGSIATATLAAMSGASIIRVHDVEETMDVVKIVAKTLSVD
jgi:dihydropteroate synthase